jgi:hypothetical protein
MIVEDALRGLRQAAAGIDRKTEITVKPLHNLFAAPLGGAARPGGRPSRRAGRER